MEVQLRQLNDAVHEIIGEQLYQKVRPGASLTAGRATPHSLASLAFGASPPQRREMAFRDTSESTNSRVMWWSVGQTLLLIGSAFWQVRHLKCVPLPIITSPLSWIDFARVVALTRLHDRNFFHQKKVV